MEIYGIKGIMDSLENTKIPKNTFIITQEQSEEIDSKMCRCKVCRRWKYRKELDNKEFCRECKKQSEFKKPNKLINIEFSDKEGFEISIENIENKKELLKIIEKLRFSLTFDKAFKKDSTFNIV